MAQRIVQKVPDIFEAPAQTFLNFAIRSKKKDHLVFAESLNHNLLQNRKSVILSADQIPQHYYESQTS